MPLNWVSFRGPGSTWYGEVWGGLGLEVKCQASLPYTPKPGTSERWRQGSRCLWICLTQDRMWNSQQCWEGAVQPPEGPQCFCSCFCGTWPLSPPTLPVILISFSKGSSPPRNRTLVSCTVGRFFTDWATREAPSWQQPLLFPDRASSLNLDKHPPFTTLSYYVLLKWGGKSSQSSEVPRRKRGQTSY